MVSSSIDIITVSYLCGKSSQSLGGHGDTATGVCCYTSRSRCDFSHTNKILFDATHPSFPFFFGRT